LIWRDHFCNDKRNFPMNKWSRYYREIKEEGRKEDEDTCVQIIGTIKILIEI